MSAPETNTETQARRHRPALVGMGIVAVVVAIAFLGWIAMLFANGDSPSDRTPPAATDTGAAIETAPPAEPGARTDGTPPAAPETPPGQN